MINLNNILDNLKEKINKLKIELLNVKNNLDKISNIPTLIVILETDLTKLDLDTFKKSFSLLENNIDEDIKNLKSFKEIYQFLKDPEIENIGIKKECLDTLNKIIKKYEKKYQEFKDKLEKEKLKLENGIEKNTRLKEYLELPSTLSYEEIEELLELVNLLDLTSNDLLDLICYISKISLKRVKEIDTSFDINKDNVDELIAESNKNQERILSDLEDKEDDIYREKVLIILDLIEKTKQLLESSSLNYYLSLNENLKHYIRVDDFESASIVMPSLSIKSFLEMHYLMPSLTNLKECLDFKYDTTTIDDVISFFETYLEEFEVAKELLEKDLASIEAIDKENETSFDDDEIIETEVSDLPTFLSSSKNIILLNKTLELTSFQTDLDLKSEDILKQNEKQKGFNRALNMFINQPYEGGSGIKAKFSRPGTKKIDKLFKDRSRKKYDKDLSPYRLRTIDRIRTGYLIIPVCQENRKKIFDLYGNESILKDGTVVLLFSVIWTEASHNEYAKLNKNLDSNAIYIKKLKEIFNNPDIKKEELKEIIDESMTRCFDTLKKEDTYVH